MRLEISVNRFKAEYPILLEEENKLSNQLFEIVKKKLDALGPTIDIMKHYGYFFWHPELGTRIKTKHGIIIGRNVHNNAEIFVIGSNYEFVDQVDGYSGDIIKRAALLTREFLKVCDLEFFFKGLEHVENFLDVALEEKQRKITQKREYIERYL